MTKDEALKMAIEWTEGWYGYSPSKDAVLKACKEALKQKEWQGLTDDEMTKIFEDIVAQWYGNNDFWFKFARAIQQALKEKNTCS